MQIQVTGDTEKTIARHVESGNFATPEEVIRVAVEQLDDFDEAVIHIQAGIDDLAAGRVSSLADVDARMRQKFGIPPG